MVRYASTRGLSESVDDGGFIEVNILWEGETHQHEGYEGASWSFITPNALQVPAGTRVCIITDDDRDDRR